jgi:hypothetical protein
MDTQFQLNHPKFTTQEQAVNELASLALQVAKNQRGEDRLQPLDTVKAKFWHEMLEFENAPSHIEKLSELADLVYYQVQEFAHNGDERDLNAVVEHLASKCNVSVEQAYTVALTKYRLRAVQPKNFEVENAAIRAALEE